MDDGAVAVDVITSGLKGYIPVFLKALVMLSGEKALPYGLTVNRATSYLVMDTPGFACMYILHSLL